VDALRRTVTRERQLAVSPENTPGSVSDRTEHFGDGDGGHFGNITGRCSRVKFKARSEACGSARSCEDDGLIVVHLGVLDNDLSKVWQTGSAAHCRAAIARLVPSVSKSLKAARAAGPGTRRDYIVGSVETTRRVARKRVGLAAEGRG
jgi:hypothetical protein